MGLVRGPIVSFLGGRAGKEVKVKDPEIYRQIWWEILGGCRDIFKTTGDNGLVKLLGMFFLLAVWVLGFGS